MWIKTQETDTHRAMLVNMDRIDTVSIDKDYKGVYSLIAIGQLTSSEDFANITTLFSGSKEDCRACLDWIMNRLDWNETTCDINDWIESRKPVKASDFPEETGNPADPDEIPF